MESRLGGCTIQVGGQKDAEGALRIARRLPRPPLTLRERRFALRGALWALPDALKGHNGVGSYQPPEHDRRNGPLPGVGVESGSQTREFQR